MGQKVNPIAFRLGVTETGRSNWFGASNEDYAEQVIRDYKIRRAIKKEYRQMGSVSRIDIAARDKNIKVYVHSAQPGILVNGVEPLDAKKKKIKPIRSLDTLLSAVVKENKLEVGSVQKSILEVPKPEIDAQLIAENVVSQLERRVGFRRAMKRAIANAMRAGAEGIRIQVKGRVNGAEIARTEKYHEGRVPLHTLRAKIDYALAEAKTVYGILGVKVWVCQGEQLGKCGLIPNRDDASK